MGKVGITKEGEEKIPPNDLMYHHAFALFQTYAALINIPICIYWAGGPQRTQAILAETDSVAILLVIMFSIVWGVGTVLFGLACKIAGIGLGTNLSMGIIAVIGTFLPLIIEETLITATGGVICVGLVICCFGLLLSTKALSMRDKDESEIECDEVSKEVLHITSGSKSEGIKQGNGESVDGISKDVSKVHSAFQETDEEGDTVERLVADVRDSNQELKEAEFQYPTWKKIVVCVGTGVCASQLQFAFVFGGEITDLALGKMKSDNFLPGSTPDSGGAAIIWLLAISLSAPVSIIHALKSSSAPLSSVIKAPLSRHLKIIFTTSLPWIAHIHIYGVCSTILFPVKVASSVGWPMLMMTTTGQALVLSVILGEWKEASEGTIRTLKCSILTTAVGIGVLMASLAVPTNE